jgi:hypothetical protein
MMAAQIALDPRFSAVELQRQRAFWQPIYNYLQRYGHPDGVTLDLGARFCHFINNIMASLTPQYRRRSGAFLLTSSAIYSRERMYLGNFNGCSWWASSSKAMGRDREANVVEAGTGTTI